MQGLPPVAMRDLVIHPRDADLVAGSHGRSIWIADDITPLQQLTPDVLAKDVHLFTNRVGTKWRSMSKGRIQAYFKFRGGNPPPGASINFYLAQVPASLRVVVEDPFSGRQQVLPAEPRAGLNRVRWNFQFDPTDDEATRHRTLLENVLATLRERLRSFRNANGLDQMQKDLLARQRYPNPYEDEDYPERDDARRLLLDHLGHIETRLAQAESVRDFFQVREQLLAYSPVMGDEAFFGFYGEELRAVTAKAGRYRVVVTADGVEFVGSVSVREDPLQP